MVFVHRIGVLERALQRQQGRVAGIRHRLSLLEAGTPEHEAIASRLDSAETLLFADTRVLDHLKRRLRLYRALGVERFMGWPS